MELAAARRTHRNTVSLDMKNKHLGRVVVFGTCVLAGLLILRVYWFKKAFDVAEKTIRPQRAGSHETRGRLGGAHTRSKKALLQFLFRGETTSALDSKALDSQLRREFLVRNHEPGLRAWRLQC